MGIDNERNDNAKPTQDPLIGNVLSVESASQATSISPPQQGEKRLADTTAEYLASWKQLLLDASTNLLLPTDRPYPAVHTFVGAWQEFELPQALTAHLTMLSQQEGVSFYIILLASFQVLLSRYSGQDDFLVGTPIVAGSQAAPGDGAYPLANLLALRADTSGNPTFRDLLQRVRQAVTEAQAHEDVVFTQVVQEPLPESEPSRHPLLQVMFVLEPPQIQAQEEGAFTPKLLMQFNEKTRPDLTLWIQEAEQEFRGWIEYNRSLFDAQTIMRLGGHWQTLLEGCASNPEQRIDDLPLLTWTELHQLLVAWNDTKSEYPAHTCIQQLIESQVQQTPDAVAVVYEGEELTYNELNCRANALAHALQVAGVMSEVLVGVCMERSLDMVIALLSILKAGGAYVPLDPTYPRERLDYMVQDAQMPIVLTHKRLLDLLPQDGTKFICLDTHDVETLLGSKALWEAAARENPVSNVQPDNLVYMIYTSGSTGQPKGVMNIHRGLCNRLHWMQQAYQLTPQDRVMQKTPFSFDVSGWEFFWPLMTGARLVMAEPWEHQNPTYLISLIDEQQVTTLHFVPSMLHAFLQEPGLERCTSLKRVICSGEALPVELQERFFAHFTTVELHNLYGPTEASIDVSYWQCHPGSQVMIGRPIANTQLYILDRAMHPVPIGVTGELCIGGVGVARGYFNRLELTAEKFVRDPFRKELGATLFKTGDLVRYRADGAIEYLGRIDHQVKIRGFRIELGEIEAILVQHLAIKEVVVVAREDTQADKRLVAYLVRNPAFPEPLIEALQDFLREKLPHYMLPATFVFLDALPLMHNGKINRNALPAPEHARPELQSAFQRARTPLEETIATIWSQVLAIEGVGIHDNFFALGGNSLQATQILSRLRVAFQVDVPLRGFFEAPTVTQLAEHLQLCLASIVKPGLPPIRRVPREAYRLPSGRERDKALDVHTSF